MKRLRVLVCGTNYGRIYLDALNWKHGRYELVGILASGSSRSIAVAAQHGVRLFHTVEELPSDIDIACAAMGTSGSEAVMQLLDRGIHVLAEHPLRSAYLNAAFAKAAERNVCFHVNAHLAALPLSRTFIEECRSLLRGKPPVFISVMATDRSLYATIDLLMLLLQDPPDFKLASRNTVPQFAILNGSFGPIGVSFQIQNSILSDGSIRPDGGAGYVVDCRVAVASPKGMLTLMSINGPVVWNVNYGGTRSPSSPSWKIVGSRKPDSGMQLYLHRVQANLDAIDMIARCRKGREALANQTPNHVLAVSRLWEVLCKKTSSDWLLA